MVSGVKHPTKRIAAAVVTRRLLAPDDTLITYYIAGHGPRVWVIPPGLGTPLIAWKRVIERFAGELTIITWCLRGTYESGAPRDLARLRVEDHVADLEAIVDAEGLERFALGGWSLAVQIALEYAARHPEQVSALLLLNGAYEHVLRTALAPGLEPLLRAIVHGLARVGRPLGPLIAWSARVAPQVAPHLGLVRRDAPLFGEVVRAFASLDWPIYFRMALQANQHTAAAHLDHVRAPTLITAGDADRVTPISIAHTMHRRIPGSELVVFPGGTHYTPTEFPDALNEALADFFARHP